MYINFGDGSYSLYVHDCDYHVCPVHILSGHSEVLCWLLLPHVWAVSLQVGGAGLDTALPGDTRSGPQYDSPAAD